MNKAFTREPDGAAEHCPRCGSKGEPVGEATLAALLTPAQRESIAPTACFCPSPGCAVAYFDVFERVVPAADLARPAYPKDPNAPLCACFGLTVDDVEQDVAEGGTRRVKEALERAKSPAARCAENAANGRPCVAYVQKCYLECVRRRRGAGPG